MKPTVLIFLALSLPAPAEWELTWSDEFDGAEIDRTKWGFRTGNGFHNEEANQFIPGWGNGELQYYTKDNAYLRDGKLVLEARKEPRHGCCFTSARLRTADEQGKPLFAQRYGRFEIRARLPVGQGLWPAIWMMPSDKAYGGWAASGEIDVMEARGQEPGKTLGTIHYGGYWPANVHSGAEHVFPEGESIAQFHVYALEWEPGEIRWSVDGRVFSTKRFWWSTSKRNQAGGLAPAGENDLNPWPAPFDQPFHLIVNLAVGGRFPGAPDQTTTFPARMEIDYVRVYANPEGYGEAPARGVGPLPFAE